MFNITIDGCAGSGKTSLATRLSKSFKLKYFNTGAMYRAITCEYLKRYRESPNREIIGKFLKDLKIQVEFKGGVEHVIVNGTDYTSKLRDPKVTKLTPLVSSFNGIRMRARKIQREFAKSNNCVMEGRDIGSTVLKDADLKFFLVSKSEMRAKRRVLQLKLEGKSPSYKKILNEIERRDMADKERKYGRLRPARDAIIIDNSYQSLDDTFKKCRDIVKNVIKSKGIKI